MGHAEQVQIKSVTNSTTFVLKTALQFPHNASVYSLSKHMRNNVPCPPQKLSPGLERREILAILAITAPAA